MKRRDVVQFFIGLVICAASLSVLHWWLPSLSDPHLTLGSLTGLAGFVGGVLIGDALARLL